MTPCDDLVSLQSLAILTDGDDQDGRLVLVDGKLAAVLARLDSEAHAPKDRGRWHIEAGFGPCETLNRAASFSTLGDVVRWVENCVDGGAKVPRPRSPASARSA